MDGANSFQGSQATDRYADQGAGYDSVRGGYQQAPQHDMGGGQGAMGSGVAGGHEGSASNNASSNSSYDTASQSQGTGQGQPAEKQDWLDKGLEAMGKKAGYSMVSWSA